MTPVSDFDDPGRSIPGPKSKPAESATQRGSAATAPATTSPVPGAAPVPGSAPVPATARPVSVKGVRGSRPAPVVRPRTEPARTTPILVRQMRGEVVESRHRGVVVEVGVEGVVRRSLGDIDTLVNLRSAVKPFGLVAFVEQDGVREFDLTTDELAVMAGSHSGEDIHVRTLQGLMRRAGVSQQYLGCGADGAPLDALTAARLARDGEKPGPLRHMCSGQHVSMLLLCKINTWPLDGYWRADHPVQRLYAATVARVFATLPELLTLSTDACGVPTYAFPLHEVARAFAMLADPAAIPDSDPRASLAPALTTIRDAMIAHPEMVAGTRDRLDTSVMKAAPGKVVAKGGAEGLRGFGIMASETAAASGLALKIEDGGGFDRATSAVSVESLAQIGALDAAAVRALNRYHYPDALDPRGERVGEAIPEFDLAPVGELL